MRRRERGKSAREGRMNKKEREAREKNGGKRMGKGKGKDESGKGKGKRMRERKRGRNGRGKSEGK